MDKIRVLLADDHTLIRSGIVTLLQSSKDIQIVGEAADGDEAIRKTGELLPDVVVIDLSMPKLSGIEATKILKRKYPDTHVLVLTMHENEEYVFQILKSGASGYVLKSAGKEELSAAIRAASKGEKFFSPRISQLMAEGYVRRVDHESGGERQQNVPLTRREREVLSLVVRGLTNQQIADQLYISPRTVDTHRTNIMQKLDIHDVANLVRYAMDHGITSEGDGLTPKA
ncbi:MAG TPA: DNA-binding response regulator [Bacteroidetes bacterium]|nr:MAG: DNA-binding response regulator [Ignavibacteria bacterium GWA2_54_16]HCA80637.1 DNA-binding response regulator [Bacteroidota bacterium]